MNAVHCNGEIPFQEHWMIHGETFCDRISFPIYIGHVFSVYEGVFSVMKLGPVCKRENIGLLISIYIIFNDSWKRKEELHSN